MARKNHAGLSAKAAEKWGSHQKKDYYQARLSGLFGFSFFKKYFQMRETTVCLCVVWVGKPLTDVRDKGRGWSRQRDGIG